jgi:predicted negative regulator of RcsB-dependent stress response
MRKYLLIGGGILALGVVGYLIYRKMSKATAATQQQQIKQQIQESQAKGNTETATKLSDDLVKNKFGRK